MKKQYIVVGITCLFLIISGICYSCAYNDSNTSPVFEENNGDLSKVNQNQVFLNSDKVNLEDQDQKGIDSDKNMEIIEFVGTKESGDSNLGNEEKVIYVHICGAVIKPGVYQTNSGARLFDLIEMSGGLQKEAASDYINQAQNVTDGQRIYIPTKEEVKELTAGEYLEGDQSSPEDTKDTPERININTADANELMNLPGIGQAKADSIIEYRVTKGKFLSIEELMKIPGIKEGLFQQISAYIIVK